MRKKLLLAVLIVPLMAIGPFIALIMTVGAISGTMCDEDQGEISSVQITIDGDEITVNGKPLTPEQRKVAQEIIGQGRSRDTLNDRDIITALATGQQESGLRNLRYGHLDSLGVFQQRPSQGWGTVEQILNVPYTVSKFYDALEAVSNRYQMTIQSAAEAVQKPAPGAYDSPAHRFADWLPLARALLDATEGDPAESTTTTTPQCALSPGSGGVPTIPETFGELGVCPAGDKAGTPTIATGQQIQLCNVYGVIVEAGISANFKAMLDASRRDGIELSGSGFRDFHEQVRLRMQNCGTSDYAIWHMPSGMCHPPTAIPGTSEHEKGRAIDMRWRYATSTFSYFNPMVYGSAGHNWLTTHALSYGFKQLPSESWHWSTTGT